MRKPSTMSKSKSRATTRRGGNAGRAAPANSPFVYVYAAIAGRPPARAMARLTGLPDGGRPRVLPIDDRLSAVVADVPSDIYNPEALEPRLADLDWVGARGVAHHAVADALFASRPVVPFRLFTLFSTEAKAHAALRALRPRILRAFARLKGRKEFVLRIGRPEAPRLRPTAVGDPAEAQSRSGTGFLKAKAATRREANERNTRVSRSAIAVFEALERVADAARANPAPGGTNLLLDAAFLVDARKTAAFRRTLTRESAELLRDGCPVSLTGPWPPYSFASAD
jgi:hypothetical protein